LPLESRYSGKTVLAVGAHADDAEIAAGGTLARLRRAGARVVMLVVSLPGDYALRRREAERAAAILGSELRVLLPDASRRVEDLKSCELVAMLDREVREYRPAAMLTHGPTEFHRDHVLVHQACRSTQRLAYFDFFTYQPISCRAVPMAFQPRAYVDISETIDTKMRAIEAHASQFKERGIGVDLHRDIARLNGRMIGAQYAEALDVGRMVLA
jgi:LmbE family N-acetylglucosaminyl deacetylase